MIKKSVFVIELFSFLLLISSPCIAQQASNAPSKPFLLVWDGLAVVGYVNRGAFINFGGPTVKLIKKPLSVGFGILPTMRIKVEQVVEGAKKNSIVTPTAGFGFTMVFKHVAIQVPFYYNAKSSTLKGTWNGGLGIGYKF